MNQHQLSSGTNFMEVKEEIWVAGNYFIRIEGTTSTDFKMITVHEK